MEYTVLENTNLKVSRFCMGGCPMGGYGWGNVDKKELIESIHKAIDLGVNFFDTADTYGLGQSEITLSEGLSKRRKDVVIQTKFGVRVGKGKTVYDNSPDYIREALEASLKRLKTDYIDVFTIHYRDGVTPISCVIDTLLDLKKEGKIRYFGLSNIHKKELGELLPYKGLFVDCQDEYSLACKENEQDLLRVQRELKVTPLTWGSLGQGILTGKYNKDNIDFSKDDRRSRDVYVNFHGEKLEQNLRIVEELKKIAYNHNKSVAACAIRYILDKINDSVVITGVKRPSQLLANLDSFDWNLRVDEMEKLEEVSS